MIWAVVRFPTTEPSFLISIRPFACTFPLHSRTHHVAGVDVRRHLRAGPTSLPASVDESSTNPSISMSRCRRCRLSHAGSIQPPVSRSAPASVESSICWTHRIGALLTPHRTSWNSTPHSSCETGRVSQAFRAGHPVVVNPSGGHSSFPTVGLGGGWRVLRDSASPRILSCEAGTQGRVSACRLVPEKKMFSDEELKPFSHGRPDKLSGKTILLRSNETVLDSTRVLRQF